MNALILSALLGVIMMFSGILLKQKSAIRNVAISRIGCFIACEYPGNVRHCYF